jgi:hypothetical protein
LGYQGYRGAAGTGCGPESEKRRVEVCRVLLHLGLILILAVSLPILTATAGPVPSTSGNPTGTHGAPPTTGPIITDTAIPQALGTFTLFLPWFVYCVGGNFSPNWRRVSAGGDYTSINGAMQLYYGLLPRTEVYLDVPCYQNWASSVSPPGPQGQRFAEFGGLGDVSLTGKYLLLEEQGRLPAVSGILTTTFPTGHHLHLNSGNLGTDLLGQGSFSFTPGLNLFKYVPPVLLYGNLWYTMYTRANVAGARLYYPDRVNLNFALEYPIPGTPLVILWELVSYFDACRLLGPRANVPAQAEISTLPALEFIGGSNWALAGGVLIDLAGKNTQYTFSPNLSWFFYF